ncbi:MAG: EscU/YscU/HrcU family type III secretion system export apparatus switch protein [Acidimicrobiia bacterium]
MSSDRSQKTEAPTPKKKKEARKQGQVAKSPELVAWVSLLAATYLLRMVVQNTGDGIEAMVVRFKLAAAHPSPLIMRDALAAGLKLSVTAVMPLALGLMALGTVVELAQVGIRPSFHRLKPDLKKVNPLKGMKRIFSVKSLWEVGKAILRIVVVAAVAYPIVSATSHTLLAQGASLDTILSTVSDAIFTIIRNAAFAGLVIAFIDFAAIQKRRLMTDLKMTKQEVKEEHRQSEGDPQMKGAIRSKRNGGEPPDALRGGQGRRGAGEPTHYAIALSYRVDKGAPEVVAREAGPRSRPASVGEAEVQGADRGGRAPHPDAVPGLPGGRLRARAVRGRGPRPRLRVRPGEPAGLHPCTAAPAEVSLPDADPKRSRRRLRSAAWLPIRKPEARTAPR